ncbi:MAG: hypothetical protein ACM3UU_05285 [Ignavibacteriales bacterium]
MEEAKRCNSAAPKKETIKGPDGKVLYNYIGYDPQKAEKAGLVGSPIEIFEVKGPNDFRVSEVRVVKDGQSLSRSSGYTSLSDGNLNITINSDILRQCYGIQTEYDTLYEGNKITFGMLKWGTRPEVSGLYIKVEDAAGNKSQIATADKKIDEEYLRGWDDKVYTEISGDKAEEHIEVVRAMLKKSQGQDERINILRGVFNVLENKEMDGIVFNRGYGRNTAAKTTNMQRCILDKLSGDFDKIIGPTMKKFNGLPRTNIEEVHDELKGIKQAAHKFIKSGKPEKALTLVPGAIENSADKPVVEVSRNKPKKPTAYGLKRTLRDTR